MRDFLDDDFDDGCSGFYRVWYGRTKPPSGPHWSIKEMAVALQMTSYPDDGYVVWYQEGEGPSSVPSLNPDDLLVNERLEYLRGELRAERISYAELEELQGLAAYIEADDIELLEAAGVPEFPEEPA